MHGSRLLHLLGVPAREKVACSNYCARVRHWVINTRFSRVTNVSTASSGIFVGLVLNDCYLRPKKKNGGNATILGAKMKPEEAQGSFNASSPLSSGLITIVAQP